MSFKNEDGNVVKGAKVKKPFYKRWWFKALLAFIIIGVLSGGDDKKDKIKTTEPETVEEETNVPREHRNALNSAKNYIQSGMGFSEKSLEEHLAFDNFPQDSIDYAIENLEVDYNQQALISAENYEKTEMGFQIKE